MSRYKKTAGIPGNMIEQPTFTGWCISSYVKEKYVQAPIYSMAIILSIILYSQSIAASQTIAPEPTTYDYQLCVPENYSNSQFCTVWLGGTFVGNSQVPSCVNEENPFPWKSEALLVPKAVEYRSAVSGSLNGWLGQGGRLSSNGCWYNPASYLYAIETSSISPITITGKDGSSWSGSVYARRDRKVSCTKGYTLNTSGGCVLKIGGIAPDKNLGKTEGNFCQIKVGNPINLGFGNKYQVEGDIQKTFSNLKFIRHYNSKYANKNYFIGKGWRHTYDRSIERVENSQYTTAFVSRPDGKVLYFSLIGNVWTPDEDMHEKLVSTYDIYGIENGWALTTSNEIKELYNLGGQLTAINYPDGKTLTVTYDPISGQAGQISDISGNNITLVYEQAASSYRIKEVQYFNKTVKIKAYQYRYDANNNLEYVDNPDGTTKQYHYEDNRFINALTGITDERGNRYATFAYDSQARANLSTHANNAERVDIIYNTGGSRTVTDSRGNASTYTTVNQQGMALVTSITGPGCSSCSAGNTSYVYDTANNNLLSKTREGLTTTYGNYDTNGNPGYIIQADSTLKARRTDYTYDSRFYSKVLTKSEPSVAPGNKKLSTYSYDDMGNIISISISGFRPDGTPVSRVINVQYNGPLNQLSQIDGPRSDVNDITSLTYYPNDATQGDNRARLQSMIAAGITVRDNIQYTVTGKVASELRPNGQTNTYTYYPGNDRLNTLTQSDGITSQVTRWSYLPTGEVQDITLADGTADATKVSLSYDNARRLTRITDGLGNYIQYTLDTEGNTTSTDTYDNSGVLLSTLTKTFDVYNRLNTINQANESVDYDFNTDGTLDKATDGKARVTQYSYDELKRLKTVTADVGGSDTSTQNTLTQYGYDISGNLNLVTDPNNGATSYVYDDLGNLLSQTSPDTGTRTYTHDEAGNTLTLTDARGKLFTYSYDALNRMTYTDAPGIIDDIAYTYDNCPNGQGALCYISTSQVTTSFDYDVFGNITLHQGGSYTHDNANRLKTITYRSGAIVTYDYDMAGQVSRVTLNNNGTVVTLADNIIYAPFGSMTNLVYGNGLSLSQNFDSAYRLTNQTVSGVLALDYSTYDANGNLNTRIDNLTVTTDGFTYDALNRLDTANGTFGTRDYDYDRNGNRNQLIDDIQTNTYSYALQSNRINTINATNVSTDTNGNITSIHGMTLGHNSQNRIVDIDNGRVKYVYNGLGQRVKKISNQLPGTLSGDADGNGVIDQTDFSIVVDHILEKLVAANDPDCNQDTLVNVQDLACINNVISGSVLPHGTNEINFVYNNDGQLIGEYDGANKPIREIIYLNNTPLVLITNGNVFYIHTDHMSTPLKLTDTNGTVAWSASYDPFGQATVDEDVDGDGVTVTFNFRFPGQYYDGETGLHYNYFRYYDPSTGRYITSDPIGLQGGLNTYGYVGGNPVGFVDPYGLRVLNPNNYTISPAMQTALNNFNNVIGQNNDIVITGGNRPPNSNLGAGSTSQHALGTAADIFVPGQKHLQTANQALQCGIFTGVGWYEEGYRGPNGEGPHVHVDLRKLAPGRTKPAQWGYDKNGNYGGIPAYNPPSNQSCSNAPQSCPNAGSGNTP